MMTEKRMLLLSALLAACSLSLSMKTSDPQNELVESKQLDYSKSEKSKFQEIIRKYITTTSEKPHLESREEATEEEGSQCLIMDRKSHDTYERLGLFSHDHFRKKRNTNEVAEIEKELSKLVGGKVFIAVREGSRMEHRMAKMLKGMNIKNIIAHATYIEDADVADII